MSTKYFLFDGEFAAYITYTYICLEKAIFICNLNVSYKLQITMAKYYQYFGNLRKIGDFKKYSINFASIMQYCKQQNAH